MRYINSNKLEKLKIDKDNYYVILDFDKTITSKKSLDSWMAIADFEILGEECKKEVEQLNAKYSPIELDYTLDYETKKQYMVEWYEKSMDILYQYGLTHSKLLKSLQKGRLEFRKGAKEFLDNLHEKNIPVIILSAGIGNAIEEFLKMNHCYYDNIYIISNFIQFKEDKMQKFTNPIIHSMNKKIEGSLSMEWQGKIKKKQYAILCGDIIEDIQMVRKEDLNRTITIGFLNEKVEENLKFYQKNYDVVLTNEEACFQEVEKIIRGDV